MNDATMVAEVAETVETIETAQEECQLAAQQSAAEAAEAERLAQAEKEGAKILGKAVTTFKGARKAFFKGMVATGSLARQYVAHCQRATNKTRSAAVKAVDASLAVWSDEALDVNQLMLVSATVELCGIDVSRERLSYKIFADSFAQLVERTCDADGIDVYRLLPGHEGACVALVSGLLDSEANRKECAAKVAELLAEHAREVREAREAESAAKRADAEKAKREREEAERAAQLAKEESARAAQAASVAVDSEKESAEIVARQAREEAERKAAEAKRIEAAARQADRERKAAERAEALAKERELRAEARAERKVRAESGEAPSPLVKVMNAGTPKDIAGQLADAISSADAPTDIWDALLAALDNHPSLDKAFLRSVKAARVALASGTAAAVAAS